MKTSDIGYFVSIALAIVFCGLSLFGIKAERKLSDLGLESIAPENLRTAAETFRLNLAVEKNTQTKDRLSKAKPDELLKAIEDNAESIEELSKTQSWNALEAKLSAYATRLERLREHRHSMNLITHGALMLSALSMLIFSIARKRRKSRQAP